MANEINSRMRQIREALKLSQLAMSEALGLDQSSYSVMETKSKGISGPVCKLLEILFNVNIEFLLLGNGEMFTAKNKIGFNYGESNIQIQVLQESIIKYGLPANIELVSQKLLHNEEMLKEKDNMIKKLNTEVKNLNKLLHKQEFKTSKN